MIWLFINAKDNHGGASEASSPSDQAVISPFVFWREMEAPSEIEKKASIHYNENVQNNAVKNIQ